MDFKDKLRLSSEDVIREYFDELDKQQVSFPESHKDVNEDVLRHKLEQCSLAQDTILKIERVFREDLSILKMYHRNRKTDFKVSYHEILSGDDRKISAELKKASAETQLKDKVLELSAVESWVAFVESSLEYVLSKKAEVKQKSIDFKTLYKIYATDKEQAYIPSWGTEVSTTSDRPPVPAGLDDLLSVLD